MLKRLGLLIMSLGLTCAYAAPDQSSSAPVVQVTADNASSSVAEANTAATADQASADAATVQAAPAVVTAPLVFQVGKQKLEVNQGDVVHIMPTDDLCTDGVAVQLTDTMGSQLHNLTANNQNQNLKILWNGMTLGDAVISTPIGASLCIGYVDTATAETLVGEFGATNSATTATPVSGN
jgi:hypothetical protein